MSSFRTCFLLVFAALQLAGCQTAAEPVATCTERAPAPHQTALGFTPWPADLNRAGVERTYAFVHDHANLIAHHFDGGIPWKEALQGAPFPRHLQDNWKMRKSNTPAQFKTFVAITPLNFERSGLALAWTQNGENQSLSQDWAGKALDDVEVKTAFLQYARSVVEFFQPDYLAIGIEANIMISRDPRLWEKYLSLNAHVFDALKKDYPGLPVFVTIQYEHLRGIEDVSKDNASLQLDAVARLVEHSDLVALSTYKFGEVHPNPMHADFFEMAESFGKPVAVAESGAMSAPVSISGVRLPASAEGQKCFLSGLLQHATEKNFPFVINWVAVDFDPMIKKLPQPMDELAKAWVHTGLQSADGKDKPALAVWDAYLESASRDPK